MNKYKVIRFFACAVFFLAFSVWGYTELIYKDAEVSYDKLREETVKGEETPEPESTDDSTDTIFYPDIDIDHEKLIATNHDYVCWLYACGGKISYPVVKGKNNDEYLHKTFFMDKSFVGSIFIDSACSPALDDIQTIFYGHSLKDRTMFRLIADFTDKSMAEQYPYIYIFTPEGKQKYEIFSVTLTDADKVDIAPKDMTDEQKAAFLTDLKQASVYPLAAEPTPESKIISLVTCDVRNDNKRVVVNAVNTDTQKWVSH